MWSYDFVFDQTEDGRRLKGLPICDEFSRELVALEVERRMEAKEVEPHLGCYSPTASLPLPLRLLGGFKTLYIKPGSPWQNAYSESFNSRFRDEFLNGEAFACVLEAKVLGKQHRPHHHQQRPHSSLDYQTPAEFAPRSLAAVSVFGSLSTCPALACPPIGRATIFGGRPDRRPRRSRWARCAPAPRRCS